MKDEKRFFDDLALSRRAVNDFAERLRRDGIKAWLPPERTRPDASMRSQYADAGDLMVQGRVEHKVRMNLHFTCREDYPYATVFIDEVYKADAKGGDPVFAYVIENASRTHAAVVYGWTRDKWTVETVRDRIQGRECENYAVDKRWVRFCDLSAEGVF
jgi:hypothetical protein